MVLWTLSATVAVDTDHLPVQLPPYDGVSSPGSSVLSNIGVFMIVWEKVSVCEWVLFVCVWGVPLSVCMYVGVCFYHVKHFLLHLLYELIKYKNLNNVDKIMYSDPTKLNAIGIKRE